MLVKRHLSLKEIKNRRRNAEGLSEKRRWEVIELLSEPNYKGKSVSIATVALVTEYSPQRVRQILRTYNEEGPEMLVRKRRAARHGGNGGRPTRLEEHWLWELQSELEDEISPYGEPWSPPVVVRWAHERAGAKLSEATARRYLDKLSEDWKERRRVVLKREAEARAKAEADARRKAVQPSLFDT